MTVKKWAVGSIVALVVIGCGLTFQRFSPHWFALHAKTLYPGEITIGAEMWPGYLALFVADEKGYFKEAGVNVKIKRYPGLGQLSKDYVAGKMQGRANLTLDAWNEHLSGLDHKIVLAIDYSNGSDAIVASGGIQTVKDFRGKRVGYEPNTLEEFFVAWALRENELDLSDVVPVSGTPEESARLLKEEKIDVAVSHEPYLQQFLSSGNFRTVYSSADAPGLVTDVLTFRTDFIEANPETVRVIVKAYFKAIQFWKDHPDEVAGILAKIFNDTSEGIARQLNGITILDEEDNRTAFTFSAGLRSLYGNLRQINEFFQQHRQKKTGLSETDAIIDRRFIMNADRG